MAYDFPFATLSELAFQALLTPEDYMEYNGKIFWNGHWYPLVAEDQNPDAWDPEDIENPRRSWYSMSLDDDPWSCPRSWPPEVDPEWPPAEDWEYDALERAASLAEREATLEDLAYDSMERAESFANMSVSEPNKFGDVGGFWYLYDEGEELWVPLTDTGGSAFFVDDTNTIPFADVDDEELHALYPGRDPLDYVDHWPEVYDMELLE
jgi:hypothetical protein